MTGFERRALASLIQALILIIVVVLLMTSSAANADSLLLLHNAGENRLVAEVVRPVSKRPMDICFDNNGDLIIRRSDVLLTLAHTSPDEIIERLRIAQRQDCRSISDISLKISFLF